MDIKNEVRYMNSNFKDMPYLLVFLTFHMLMCSLFLLALIGCFIPGFTYSIDGKVIGYLECWRSGACWVGLMIGILLPTAGILFLQRKRYARQVYLFALCITMIGSEVFVIDDAVSRQEDLLGNMIFIIFLGMYLYLRKPVRDYLFLSI